MSNIVRQVATVIREKTISDLLQENASLKAQLELRTILKVSGRDGTLFATGQLKDGSFNENQDLWKVSLEHVTDCLLSDYLSFEIRLGGIPVLTLRDTSVADTAEYLDVRIQDVDRVGLSALFEPHIARLEISVGPFVQHSELQEACGDLGGAVTTKRVEEAMRGLADRRGDLKTRFHSISFVVDAVKMLLPLDRTMVEESDCR